MAAGEYVSVSSQADTEDADIARERVEIAANRDAELEELAGIYVQRGLDEALAHEVAGELMARDALAAHARDELGISEILTARPIQAALASAATFAVGAAMPLGIAFLSPPASAPIIVSSASLAFLAVLGGVSAQVGGAPILPGIARVTFWGALAMAITAGVGALFGVAA